MYYGNSKWVIECERKPLEACQSRKHRGRYDHIEMVFKDKSFHDFYEFLW